MSAVLKLNDNEDITLSGAAIEDKQYNGEPGIVCTERLNQKPGSGTSVAEYMLNNDYVGAKVTIEDATPYKYLVFYGKENANHGQLTVRMYDTSGKTIVACDETYKF